MKSFQESLRQRATAVSVRGVEDRALRAVLKSGMGEFFPTMEDPMAMIKECRLTRATLIIKTNDKSLANELFMRKKELLKQFKNATKTGITELIIQ